MVREQVHSEQETCHEPAIGARKKLWKEHLKNFQT